MAGLDPAIHVFLPCSQGVDARDEARAWRVQIGPRRV